eukprot:CCRYP_019171-RA/>CCRYP_019171-RA protein AED:0.53 eAED:1.00 QI:0/-1/0/1/-1/1/1/0/118
MDPLTASDITPKCLRSRQTTRTGISCFPRKKSSNSSYEFRSIPSKQWTLITAASQANNGNENICTRRDCAFARKKKMDPLTASDITPECLRSRQTTRTGILCFPPKNSTNPPLELRGI